MGLCSGKLGLGANQGDVLASTAWVREVVTQHQKKRKGILDRENKFKEFSKIFLKTLFSAIIVRCQRIESHAIACIIFIIAGVSKFCNFTFEPLGRSCNDLEEYHKISVGSILTKSISNHIKLH